MEAARSAPLPMLMPNRRALENGRQPCRCALEPAGQTPAKLLADGWDEAVLDHSDGMRRPPPEESLPGSDCASEINLTTLSIPTQSRCASRNNDRFMGSGET